MKMQYGTARSDRTQELSKKVKTLELEIQRLEELALTDEFKAIYDDKLAQLLCARKELLYLVAMRIRQIR